MLIHSLPLSLYPGLSEGAALLATTGDVDFNTYIRGVALKMGLHLNEYGLWRQHTNGDSGEGRWELVASRTEEEILSELGIEFIEPERRNFSFIASTKKSGTARRSKSRRLETA